MKRGTKNILVLLGGFLLYQAYNLYTAFKRLQYGISEIHFKSIGSESVMLSVALFVKNTTPVQFLIGNLNADVYFNSIQVGRISYPINRYLYARSINKFNVGVELFYTEALQSIWSVIQGLAGQGNTTIDNWIVRIVGTIDLSERQVPLRLNITSDDLKK